MEYLFIYAMQLAGGLEGVQTVCIIFAVIAFIVLAVATFIAIEERNTAGRKKIVKTTQQRWALLKRVNS